MIKLHNLEHHKQVQRVQDLSKFLIACPHMQTLDTCRHVAEQLPPRIHRAIPTNNELQVYAYNIVKTCLNYPWGIELLIDAVRFFDHGTHQMIELDEFLDKFYPQPIARSEVVKLRDLLSNVPYTEQALQECYNAVSPNIPLPKSYIERNLLFCMLDMLAQQSIVNNTHPLLQFARCFELSANQTIQSSITEWITSTAKRLGLSVIEIPPRQTTPLYLLIDLDPNVRSPNSYKVQAWLWDKHAKNIYAEDTIHTLQEIPLLINQLRQHILQQYINASSLTIELFLPLSMIDEAVDQWVLEDDETLGFLCPMMVRSRDRARNTQYWSLWVDRWQHVDLTQPVDQQAIAQVSCHEDCGLRTLRRKLEEVICLVLNCTIPSDEETRNKLFSWLIKSGTPIALLPRPCTATPNQIREEMATLIANRILGDLTTRVWKRRRDAWEQNEQHHPGNSITLLWDDPNRLPHRQWLVETIAGPVMADS